jgi:hypothetical protein
MFFWIDGKTIDRNCFARPKKSKAHGLFSEAKPNIRSFARRLGGCVGNMDEQPAITCC